MFISGRGKVEENLRNWVVSILELVIKWVLKLIRIMLGITL